MYQRGLSVEAIARKRQISISTIYSHLAILYEQGYEVALEEMVSPAEVDKVLKSLRYLQEPYKLKDIYDYLGEQVPYHRIRLALAYGKREEEKR